MKNEATITTRNYDLRDHGIGRALRQDVRFRFLPFGSYGGGPSLFILIRLLLLHKVGAVALRLAYVLEASRTFRWLMRLRRTSDTQHTSRRG